MEKTTAPSCGQTGGSWGFVKGSCPVFEGPDLVALSAETRRPVMIVRQDHSDRVGAVLCEEVEPDCRREQGNCAFLGCLPPLHPEQMGDRDFSRVHKTKYPYVVGEMAGGISSVDTVVAAARCGLLGFLGSGGLRLVEIERAVQEIFSRLSDDGQESSWGANLIHSPADPKLEDAVVDVYLKHDVRRVSASAFMRLSPAVVRYACAGLHTDSTGRIIRKNYLFAKISRPEVAEQFMSPAPAALLAMLTQRGCLTQQEALLAQHLPLAEDITVEADSGGHTDNRPLVGIFPTMMSLRDELARKHRYDRPIRLGAAGGLGTPSAVAAAFAMGAAYVLTGSVNQAAVESGTSQVVREMLAQVQISDCMMAPSADMFEFGIKLQVLKRGTMFGVRAARLYDLYTRYPSLEAIPATQLAQIEKEILQAPIPQIWEETKRYWNNHSPQCVSAAEKDPKSRMALVFRWYLGNSSRWARIGDPKRKLDYQIWCGPAMGAFNAWVAGTFLADPSNRTIAEIALNLLEGAAVVTRAHQLRSFGVRVPAEAFCYTPRPLGSATLGNNCNVRDK